MYPLHTPFPCRHARNRCFACKTLSEWSVQRGMARVLENVSKKQLLAIGSVSGATKLRLKRSTEQRLCGPTRGAAKKMGVDHKVVNRLMYMADHDIVLIDWTRHRGPFAFKNSNSVTDSYLPYCLDLCNLQQTLSQTVSERKLNQAQQMLRLELGGCFTTAAVRQQL